MKQEIENLDSYAIKNRFYKYYSNKHTIMNEKDFNEQVSNNAQHQLPFRPAPPPHTQHCLLTPIT